MPKNNTKKAFNKTRTSKVGAISKAQNCKRGPSGFVKLQLVSKYEKKIEGEPFGAIQKVSKKSRTVPKKVGLWGDP